MILYLYLYFTNKLLIANRESYAAENDQMNFKLNQVILHLMLFMGSWSTLSFILFFFKKVTVRNQL